MESKLELAEKYYTVARDVREQAEYLTAMADTLDSYADRLCEQNMREHQKIALCPKPCAGRPDNFTAAECVAAGECGCDHTSRPQSEKPDAV